jgi:hypothetical protein
MKTPKIILVALFLTLVIGTIRCGKEELRAGEYQPPAIKLEKFHFIMLQTPTETFYSYGILITRYVYSMGQKSTETEYDPPTMGVTMFMERGKDLYVHTSHNSSLNPSKLRISLILVKEKGELLGTYSADKNLSSSIYLDNTINSSFLIIPETVKFNVKSTGYSTEYGGFAEGDYSFSLINNNDATKSPIPVTGIFKLSCQGLCP